MFTGKTKHDVVWAFRTAEILGAARKVFAEKGFADATMDSIAEQAGLAKGTLYLYFHSKRDVYMAALHQGIAELQERSRQGMEAADGLRAKIHAFIQARLDMLDHDRELIRIYYSEFGNLTHPGICSKELRALYERQLKQLEGMLQAAIAAGEMRPVRVDIAAVTLVETTLGWMRRLMLTPGIRPSKDDAELLTELLWKGIAL